MKNDITNKSDSKKHCRVCSGKNYSAEHQISEMMFGTRQKFNYGECTHCGALNLLDDVDLSIHYPSEYYAHQIQEIKAKNKLVAILDSASIRLALSGWRIPAAFLNRLHPVEQFCSIAEYSNKSGLSFLDIGGGAGEFAIKLANYLDWDFTVVDPFIDANSNPHPRVSVRKLFAHECSGKFDIIYSSHCLEHIDDISGYFRAINRLLSPGGRAIIRIPIFAKAAWRRYGVNWVQLDAPRHVCLHTEKSLEIAVRNNGLEIEKMKYDSTNFQFWASDLYERGISLKEYELNHKGKIQTLYQLPTRLWTFFKADLWNRKFEGDQITAVIKLK